MLSGERGTPEKKLMELGCWKGRTLGRPLLGTPVKVHRGSRRFNRGAVKGISPFTWTRVKEFPKKPSGEKGGRTKKEDTSLGQEAKQACSNGKQGEDGTAGRAPWICEVSTPILRE